MIYQENCPVAVGWGENVHSSSKFCGMCLIATYQQFLETCNNRGAKAEPCVTPYFTFIGSENFQINVNSL